MTNNFEIPDKYEGTVYIMMSIRNASFGRMNVYTFDASDENDILFGTAEISIPLDTSRDLRQIAAKSLKATKAKIQAEAFEKAQELQAKIDNLLAIEYSPEPDILDDSFEDITLDLDDEIPF